MKSHWGILFLLTVFAAMQCYACEQCKCQGCNSVECQEACSTSLKDAFNKGNQPEDKSKAEPEPQRTKWYFDTLVEYVSYAHVNVPEANHIVDSGRDTHGHVNEWDVTERFGYAVTSDLLLTLAQGYRSLKMLGIDDDDLGKNERSAGPSDLDFGIAYRFLHQKSKGCPVDLVVFGDIKFPTGVTNNRKPTGDLFETEDQPGTGSFNETIGLSAGKTWGRWSATAAYAFTYKGEGSQEFKEGNVNRLALNASRKMTPDDWGWALFLSQGFQGWIENRAVDHHVTSPDHGGDFIYAVPGISVRPNRHLILTASAAVPVYQQENGFHQKDNYSVQFNIGIRF
jgi:hypothetical protein